MSILFGILFKILLKFPHWILTTATFCDIIYKLTAFHSLLYAKRFSVILFGITFRTFFDVDQNLIRRNIEAVTTRRSWKFVGLSDANKPKPLENTDYFGTPKIAKTRISNVISNTFQNHNLIRRNIEAVTTRRSWKPFAQKARGFESLFLRQIKGQPSPKSSVVFLFLWHWYERIWTSLCDSQSRRMGFAFERKPSGSLLTSGGAKNLRQRRIYLTKAPIK